MKQTLGKRRANKYNKFNWLFLLFVSIPLSLVGTFNLSIDPYDVFDTPNWLGINHVKPKKDNNDRLFKASDLIRLKPTTLILGSSRTKQGIDPEHPALSSDRSTYNLAINGPNTYEIRRYLEHAIANQSNIKEIVFGVDFFMFNATLKNQPSFSEDRLEKTHIVINDAINTLFSLDTFYVSQATVEASLKEKNKDDIYGENGFMPNRTINDGNTKWRFDQSIELYFKLHSDYEFSDEYLAEFKKIVELCQQNKINLKVFISPSHATDMDAIRATGRWETMEKWKREIVKIVPVWDFSGYNSVTTEPIKDVMKNYADNSHYTVPIGNLILDRVLAYQSEKVPLDFGVLITSENIESHLQKINSDRQSWAKNHTDEVKLVETIKQKINNKNKRSK
ncbi:MAG: hypothetical protein ACRC2R_15315 [Xenococcaceae cyanobacterium]